MDALLCLEQDCSIEHAAQTLKQIVHDHPAWAEPHARLALLNLLQHNYEKAQDCVDACLALKPWHFEAQQLQLLLFLIKGDQVGAIQWARTRCLPPRSQPRRRRRWIAAALEQAAQQLAVLEHGAAAAAAVGW